MIIKIDQIKIYHYNPLTEMICSAVLVLPKNPKGGFKRGNEGKFGRGFLKVHENFTKQK